MKPLVQCLIVLMIAGVLYAQDDSGAFSLNVNSDLMELHVSVVDEKERTVSGLNQENFQVTENGVRQKISFFKHEDIPVSLGLVLDNSRSIEPRKARLDAAALSFVHQSNPEDETFVVHFDFDARLDRDFTSKLPELEQSLTASKPFGQTAIYDALLLALDHMKNAKQQKKVLLLVTDGLDNVSKATLNQLLDTIKRSRVAIIVVGLLSAAEGEKAEQSLSRIAEASGGRAYFPEDVDQARVYMEKTARDLRTQYTIGYVPTDPVHDGSWRSVRVNVTPPPGSTTHLEVDYRHGYYRPEP